MSRSALSLCLSTRVSSRPDCSRHDSDRRHRILAANSASPPPLMLDSPLSFRLASSAPNVPRDLAATMHAPTLVSSVPQKVLGAFYSVPSFHRHRATTGALPPLDADSLVVLCSGNDDSHRCRSPSPGHHLSHQQHSQDAECAQLHRSSSCLGHGRNWTHPGHSCSEVRTRAYGGCVDKKRRPERRGSPRPTCHEYGNAMSWLVQSTKVPPQAGCMVAEESVSFRRHLLLRIPRLSFIVGDLACLVTYFLICPIQSILPQRAIVFEWDLCFVILVSISPSCSVFMSLL